MKKTGSKLNWLERTISFISPTTGVRRQRARLAASMLRGYEGAASGRRTDGWIATGTDANAEIRPGVRKLRERSRDLVRNNAYANRIVSVIVSNSIGYGITGNVQVFDAIDKTDKENLRSARARMLWKQWSDGQACDYAGQLSLSGLQQQALTSIVQSGGAILRRIRVKPTPQSPIPFKIQVLEPDFIDIDKDADNCIQGVQYDTSGRLKGYWLFDSHPGSATSSGTIKSSLIPASEVRYCMRPDRPGQVHGVPWLAPVMMLLKDLDEMMDATLFKQKISAAFTAFVHDMEAFDGDLTKKSAPLGEKMEPGLIEILPPGKEITFANPPSAADFPEFVKAILRAIATGVGVPYEAATGDLTSVSFTSGRMGWLEFHRLIEQWRWNMFIPQFLGGVGEWFNEALVLTGDARESDFLAWSWTPPRREQIDPVAETNSAINAVRGGVKSLRQVHEELGEDHGEVLAQIEATNKILDEKQIMLDSDPRRIMKAGIVQSGLDAAKVGDLDAAKVAPADPAAVGEPERDVTDSADDEDTERYYQASDGRLFKRTIEGKFEPVKTH